jgi:predicted metalloendopeptidase
MVKYLKGAFRRVINEEDWLDDAKKKEVIEKVVFSYPRHFHAFMY